jgi:hypothetical protein
VELDMRGLQAPEGVTIDGQAASDWQHADGRVLIRLGASTGASAGRVVEVTARLNGQ